MQLHLCDLQYRSMANSSELQSGAYCDRPCFFTGVDVLLQLFMLNEFETIIEFLFSTLVVTCELLSQSFLYCDNRKCEARHGHRK